MNKFQLLSLIISIYYYLKINNHNDNIPKIENVPKKEIQFQIIEEIFRKKEEMFNKVKMIILL